MTKEGTMLVSMANGKITALEDSPLAKQIKRTAKVLNDEWRAIGEEEPTKLFWSTLETLLDLILEEK